VCIRVLYVPVMSTTSRRLERETGREESYILSFYEKLERILKYLSLLNLLTTVRSQCRGSSCDEHCLVTMHHNQY